MTTGKTLQPLRFPLHNSRLIEASAGTGKTYTIAALYLRLVLNHGNQDERFGDFLTPEQILVVTFTDAATEELRDRIRARLSEAAAYFRQQTDQADGFLQGLRAEYADAEAWPALARKLELAAQSMDEAAVHTIHGWCNRMLREHAFASGSLFSQQLNTDTKQHWLTAARDYWRTFIAPLTAQQVDAYRLLTSEFNSPEAIYAGVRNLLNDVPTADLAPPAQLLSEVQQAEQQLREEFHSKPWQSWLADARVFLDEVIASKQAHGNKLRRDRVSNWLQSLDEWAAALALGESAALTPSLTESAWQRLTPDGLRDALHIPLPEHPLWQTLEELHHSSRALPTIRTPLLHHAAQWLQRRFSALQQQRAEMGFDDMLSRLRDALRGKHGRSLAATIRAQFPVAMIDEFQDTDPTQYEIFDRVYQLKEPLPQTGIFLIGDPKQAIYSFRNADIYTYLQARRATAGRHYTLAVNFRSTDAMVAAANQLFERAREYPRGAFLFGTTEDNPVPFTAVKANGLSRHFVIGDQPGPALRLDVLQASDKEKKPVLQAALAAQTAEQIVTLLNDPSSGFKHDDGSFARIQPGDIAILVNSAKEAAVIRSALRERAVQSVYLSDRDSVFAGAMASDLLRILQACAAPRDPGLLRAALASSLLALSLAALDLLNTDELEWDRRADQFLDYHELWQQRGVLAMLQRILHDFSVPARLLREDGGERQLTDILHLAELLQQQSALVEGRTGLLRYLAEHIQLASDEGNRTDAAEQQVRLESDSQLVQVITIHKSKGLQYPLVFLPFISNCPARHRRVSYPAKYHNAADELCLAYDKDDVEGSQQADLERLAEDVRKLYVAVTRAQFATFIGLAPFQEFKDTALCYLASGEFGSKVEFGELVAQLSDLPQQKFEIDSPLTRYQADRADGGTLVSCSMPAGHRMERWWVASYSALKYGEQITADDADALNSLEARHEQTSEVAATPEREPDPASLHGFPKGAQPGTFLHNLLEDAANAGFAVLAADGDKLAQLVNERTRLEPWHSHQQMLRDWLHDYLQTPFKASPEGGADTTFTLAGLSSYQPEPEFWFATHQVRAQQLDQLVREHILPGQARPQVLPSQLNGMLKGFIDLVFEHEGRYYVADYKSNYLGPDASSYARTAMRDKILGSRYDMQYVIYTLALHKLLKARMGNAYDYDHHIGGAVYLFMRGYQADTAGAFFDRPPRELIERLEQLFAGSRAVAEGVN
ncbi:exodeoxyribonuclease V subunit beta [Pseudidiomarina sp.]|uniref:exodeoxyribonuclease V subunit beta n=1 Tax=Pseudidiomarina sp. TaxID=2081707 RepID=UPI00299DC327|nr:exodeoxyribonuclease V subunit beta [Pseudidiomarina sp.]MDX1705376.1 exodeoxyribonuclease V subunit beta [Pseudidiomarina sp.]